MILRSFFQDILRTKLLSLPSYPACTGTSVTTRLRLSTSVPRPVFAPKYCSFINVDPHHYQSTKWLTPSYSTSHIPPTAHVHMCILFLFVCLLLLSVITAAVFNHGRRSVDGQEDNVPPTFWSGGDALYFVPPTFLGVDIVCGAQHWLHTSQFSFACFYLLLDSVSILFRRIVLFEELIILTVTQCIGVHCSNFHEI